MALQSSGAISLANIQSEFGGSNPISMNEYYRGGGLVPSSVTAVPASGAIDMADFYGTSNVSPISTTNFARLSSSGNSTYITRTVTSAIVFLTVFQEIRLRRQDNYVYYETKALFPGTWYNTSGTGSSLSSSYVTLGRFNLGGITAVKMNWSFTTTGIGSTSAGGNTAQTSATYSASDNSFTTLSNGQSIGARLQTGANAECYNTNTRTGTFLVDVTAQKSGYSDTTLGTYKHQIRAVAISNNCF